MTLLKLLLELLLQHCFSSHLLLHLLLYPQLHLFLQFGLILLLDLCQLELYFNLNIIDFQSDYYNICIHLLHADTTQAFVLMAFGFLELDFKDNVLILHYPNRYYFIPQSSLGFHFKCPHTHGTSHTHFVGCMPCHEGKPCIKSLRTATTILTHFLSSCATHFVARLENCEEA